ncbi:MAG: hypothetical protein IPL32_18770 [Chloracidobacterium sp.]|nr:hypothetical protein [Chloracidobacterium sp.]
MADVGARWNIYSETNYGDDGDRLGAACLLVQNFGLSLASINSGERSFALGRLTSEIQVVLKQAYGQGIFDGSKQMFSETQAARGSERELCARQVRNFIEREKITGKMAELFERLAKDIEVPF